MKQRLYFAIIVLLVSSCISEDAQNSASLVGQFFDTEHVYIGIENYMDTDNRSFKGYELTLENPRATNEQISNSMITSTAAFIFSKNTPAEDLKTYPKLKVTAQQGSNHFNELYSTEELIQVSQSTDVIDNFFDPNLQSKFDSFSNLFDDDYINDSIAEYILYGLNEIAREAGPINEVTVGIVDFTDDDFYDSDNTSYWVNTEHTNHRTRFRFIITTQDNKIAYVGNNE
jgi:hypothetical protein